MPTWTALGISGRAQEMRYELEEYAASARDALEEMEYNPQELDAIEQRLDTLYRLKKKYGSTVEEILAFQQKASGETGGESPFRGAHRPAGGPKTGVGGQGQIPGGRVDQSPP